MPSSIASTVVDVENLEDLEGVPPIEVSVNPDEVKALVSSEKGQRVGENGAQRVRAAPRPQFNNRRPQALPGQIEPPTRENVFVPPSCIFFTQRRQVEGKKICANFNKT